MVDMESKVTILIPTRFDSKYLIELALVTIRKYTTIPYKIIVGDAGVDKDTRQFLDAQEDIKVLNCPDPLRPKDTLVRSFDTPFGIILHDDVQIKRQGWLKERVDIMHNNPKIGILGVVSATYIYGWKRFFYRSPLYRRFFPLALMIRKEVQEELDLRWGKIPGFDTGAIAYMQFLKQKKWKFKKYKFNKDLIHIGGMTWVVRKVINNEEMLGLDKYLSRRKQMIEVIKWRLERKEY